MVAYVMALPPGDGGLRVGGLPIRLLAQDAIRRARGALMHREVIAPAPASPGGDPVETPVSFGSPAVMPVAMLPKAGPAALDRTLRGFTLIDLYVEARRVATDAAADFEHLEGLAAGRTYGDARLQPGFLTPDCYRRAAADAKARAEMAGATADFLRGMLGHELALDAMLTDVTGAG